MVKDQIIEEHRRIVCKRRKEAEMILGEHFLLLKSLLAFKQEKERRKKRQIGEEKPEERERERRKEKQLRRIVGKCLLFFGVGFLLPDLSP